MAFEDYFSTQGETKKKTSSTGGSSTFDKYFIVDTTQPAKQTIPEAKVPTPVQTQPEKSGADLFTPGANGGNVTITVDGAVNEIISPAKQEKKSLLDKYMSISKYGGSLASDFVVGLTDMSSKLLQQVLNIPEMALETNKKNRQQAADVLKNAGVPDEKNTYLKQDTILNKVEDKISTIREKVKKSTQENVDFYNQEISNTANTLPGQISTTIGGIIPNVVLAAAGSPTMLLAISESAMNMEDSYDENIKNGMDERKAQNIAKAQMVADLAGTYITDKFGSLAKFNGEGKKLINFGEKKFAKNLSNIAEFLKDNSMETVQEVWQTAIQNVATNKPITTGLAETAKIAFLSSLPFSFVGNILPEQEAKQKITEEVSTIATKVAEQKPLTPDESLIYSVTDGKDPFVETIEQPTQGNIDTLNPEDFGNSLSEILATVQENVPVQETTPAQESPTDITQEEFDQIMAEQEKPKEKTIVSERYVDLDTELEEMKKETSIKKPDDFTISEPYKLTESLQRVDIESGDKSIGHISFKTENETLFIDMIQITDSKKRNKGYAGSALSELVNKYNIKEISATEDGYTKQGKEFIKNFVESNGGVFEKGIGYLKKEIESKTDQPKTQKEKVQKAVEEKPKTIKEISEETGILEPNVRRILGMGAKEGTFSRVEKGVYILNKDGKDVAYIHNGDAVETLKMLADEGVKVDMVFLDIPYDTPAVKGGNRGVKYDLLSVEDFGKVLDSVSIMQRDDNTPVVHMFSQAPSGMKAMQKYNDLFIQKGYKPVGKGEFQKTFADGSPVTSPNGKVSQPEGIIVFTKSGELKQELGDLNFKFQRVKGYQTEKPAEMLKRIIEMTTQVGDVVLDPFAGSGVTGAEAVKAGREAILIEKNKEVAEKITKPRVEKALEEAQNGDKYYINELDKKGNRVFTEVQGKKVDIGYDIDVFYHKDITGSFVVSEGSTGLMIASSRTLKTAIAKTKEIIDNVGLEATKERIKTQAEKFGLSPRYTEEVQIPIPKDVQEIVDIAEIKDEDLPQVPVKPSEEMEVPIVTTQTENDNVLYKPFTEVEYMYGGELQTGRIKGEVTKDDIFATVVNNRIDYYADGVPIQRYDDVKVSNLTPISAPSTIVDDESIRTTDTGGDIQQPGEISDTGILPGEDVGGRSGELADTLSGYDTAISIVESGNGLGTDRTAVNGVELNSLSKKQRQLINEQVEQLLLEKNYSKDPADYTQEERDLLSNYTGSGGKESVGAEGAGLLSEYYTPQKLVNKLWDIVGKIAPQAQTAFEPSAGTGRIISSSPVHIAMDGAEISEVSGTIAQILNPDSKITIGDFQEIFFDKKTGKEKKNISQYDVVIGNPPFGDRAGFIKGKGEESKISRQEEYFIKRGLDMTKDGGTLIYVVNSSFLKKTSSEGKKRIATVGSLEKAYRLPEDIFEDTSIGTDIVIFKKQPTVDSAVLAGRVMKMSEDRYFRSQEGVNDILGTTETRKNRFGQLETYVKGDLDTALSMIKTEEVTTPIIESAKVEAETKPTPEVTETVEVKEGKKTTTRKTTVKSKKDTKKGVKKVMPQTIPAEKNYADKVVPVQELSTGIVFDKTEIDMLKRIERDGSIPNPESKEMPYLNYQRGKFYHNGLYFAGNIYEKLDQLQIDKPYIIENFGEEQYKKQLDRLTEIIPKQIPLADIHFDPLDRHIVMKMVDNGKGEQTILLNLFTQYLRGGGYSLTGKTDKYEIMAYVTNERLPQKSAEKLPQIKEDSKRLFNTFIKTVLDPAIQNEIVKEYNRTKNSYTMPDYSSIPVEIRDMAKEFRGTPFKASDVQKNGVSFLVTKGSGLIMYGVGVGKTHTLLMATVANMQKGWTKRPLFVVPSPTITKTWIATIREMFPGITINNLDGLQAPIIKKLRNEKGENVADWIKDGEISVISHSGILKLGFNEEQLKELTGELTDALWAEAKTKRAGEKESSKIEEITGIAQKFATDVMLSDLGIDHISVDEVHNFRKVFIGAKTEEDIPGSKKRFGSVEGSGTAAIRAQQLFLMSQYIQKNNGGRNVFLASATPFENKATEVYNILSLVARDRMKQMGIFNINDFYSVFADFEVEQDYKLDGSVKDTLKMKRFANVQSLQKLLREFIDTKEDKTLVRPERKILTPQLQMSEKQIDNLDKIQQMLGGVKVSDTGEVTIVEKKGGELLKAATYSIANSVSPYFIEEYLDGKKPTAKQLVEESPKIKYSLEAIRKVKNNPKTKDYGTFLFFGKQGVEYHPMIAEYFAKELGYKPEEVAIISGSSISDDVKEQVKEDFNSGKVKVLIGGDQTKEGIDLQNNGFMTINLALGWNPTQITQVEGRVWRQGNNRNIAPLIYPLVENSGDAFIYNKFEEKGARINDLFSYSGNIFDVGEIDPAEKKIALLTDPAARANMQIAIDKANVQTQRVIVETQMKDYQKMKTDMADAESNITYYKDEIDSYKKQGDLSTYQKERVDRYKKELKSFEDKLKRIKEKMKIKGITSLDSEITILQDELIQIDESLSKIDKTYDEKLAYFTEMRREEIKNQKTMEDYMKDIDDLANQVKERSKEEIMAIKQALIEKMEQQDDTVEMADFIVTPRKMMDKYVKADAELTRRKENAVKMLQSEKERGKEAILKELSNIKDITTQEKESINYFLDMFPEELFDDTALSIVRNGGSNGLFRFNSQMIELFLNNIRSNQGTIDRTFVHEMWHKLSQFIPNNVVVSVKNDFEKAKKAYIKANPWFGEYHVGNNKTPAITEEQYKSIVEKYPEAKEMFTPDFSKDTVMYVPGYKAENYRFKNLDEWVAETMTDYSLDRVSELSTDTKGVVFHLKNMFRLFIEALQRFFGYNNSSLIFKNMTEGKYDQMARGTSLIKDDTLYSEMLLDKKQQDKEVFDKAVELTEEYSLDSTKKDIGTIIDNVGNVRDIYLADPIQFPESKEIYDTADTRAQKKRILDNKIATIIKPYIDLKQAERNAVDKVLVEGNKDKVEYSRAELLNRGLSEQQVEAYLAIRKGLNLAFNTLISEMERMGIDPDEIETYKRERKGYIPARWKHKYVVKIQELTDPDADPRDNSSWKTKRIEDFETERKSKKAWEKMKSENKDKTVRFVLDRFENLSVDWFAQQSLSLGNMKTLFEQSPAPEDIKNTMLESIRDLFKSKGFGRHFIRRTDVQGYQENNLHEVFADYFTGFAGFVTKMEAGKKYFDSLAKIDARKQKKYYENMRDLIAYDMAGNTDGGVLIDGIKQFVFTFNLVNDLSFLLTNLTQNLVIGTGELSKLYKNKFTAAPEMELMGAYKDMATGNLSKDEEAVIKGLLEIGELGGEMIGDLTNFKNNPIYAAFSKNLGYFLNKATEFSERTNRVSAFLAARRILQKQGYDETYINEKALEVSKDIHFRYGKVYRAKFMRGKVPNLVFMYYQFFRSFMFSLKQDLSQKEYMAVSRKMFYTMMLGGATALPFAKLFQIVMRSLFGEDDKEELTKWQIALEKGLPAAFLGIDMSDRVAIDLMAVTKVAEQVENKEVVDVLSDVRNYIGAVGNIFLNRIPKGVELLIKGNTLEGMSRLLPDMVGNPLKAISGANYGVVTSSGKALEDVTTKKPLVYTRYEALVRAIGFTPTRESLAWDAKNKEWRIKSQKAELRDNAIQSATKDWEKSGKDPEAVKRIEEELVKQIHGKDASQQQINNVRKEFAVRRVFGASDTWSEKMLNANSNDEKLIVLQQARKSMTQEEFKDFFVKGRKLITYKSGNQSPILISDDVYQLYLKSKE